MSIQEVPAEELARFLYRYHQALAPYLGCKDTAHAEPWAEVTEPERRHLVTAAQLALMELQADELEKGVSERDRLQYFAKPGEAEWGC